MKLQYPREEIQYLLDNDFIDSSQNDRSAPFILVPKQDGTFHMCTSTEKLILRQKQTHFQCPEWTIALIKLAMQNV